MAMFVNGPEPSTKPFPTIPGFDYLRAAACLCVVAIHSFFSGSITPYAPGPLLPNLADYIYYDFTMLAVPIFFLVSLVLFHMKADVQGRYFAGRIRYFLKLYLFWSAVFILYRLAFSLYRHNTAELIEDTMTASGLMRLVMTGGGFHYYYFFSLMVVTVIAQGYRVLSDRWSLEGHAAAFACTLLALVAMPLAGMPLMHWNPLNFVPYIPGAALIAMLPRARTVAIGAALMAASVALAPMQWGWMQWYHMQPSVLPEGELLPTYARASVVLGGMALVVMSMAITKAPGRAVAFISRYALGIYCLHPYAPLYKATVFASKLLNINLAALPVLKKLLLYFMSLIDSIVITYLMKRTHTFKKFL